MDTLPTPDPAAAAESDLDLVQACRRGDARAWERLVRRFERLIFNVPRRAGLSADEAADVFQIVFMRLHEHLERLTQPDRVRAWLVTTARRETLSLLRERKRTVRRGGEAADDDGVNEIEFADPNPLPEEVLETLEAQHRVRLALQRLGGPCRRLLELLYTDDDALPYATIAQKLGMAVGSIGPTRSRCLARLRELMETTP